MSISLINHKRILLFATLGILLLIVASCTAPSGQLGSDSSESSSSVESSTTDSDAADSDAADSDTSDGDTTGTSGNTPGNVDADVSDNDDGAETATDETTADETTMAADSESDDSLTYEGMPVGYTEEGFVYRGNPDAPITIYEYSDYQCPFCQRHFYQTEPGLNEQYVANGTARLVFVDFPLTQIHPNAPAAHVASLCVAEQSPVTFWEMHNLIFETQGDWGSSTDMQASMVGLAEQLDVDMDLFSECMASGAKEPVVAAAVSEAQQLGFGGTPSFLFVMEETGESYSLVGAQPLTKFSEWIDTMAAGEVPADAVADSEEQQEGDGEIPYWATNEGLSPDPDKPGYTRAGDPYRGDEEAQVIVIEYSDFQCPFCGRHTSTTQPLLDEAFVDTGDVRWVFKHFPLNIHAQAPAAGVAAECAGEQGEFWRMHEELFAGMSSWSIREPNPVFMDIAASMGLDEDAFATCLEDEDIMARVTTDFEAGRPFVQGTPTFIVMAGEEGRIIPGALPADQFTEALQQVLDTTQ